MKLFNKIFKKKEAKEKLSKNNSFNKKENFKIEDSDFELHSLNSLNDSILTLSTNEEPTDEQLEALFRIERDLEYSEKLSLMFETFKVGFELPVEFKSVRARIGKSNIETRGENIFVSSDMGQVFFEIVNFNNNKALEAIYIKGSPDISIGLGGSAFIRSDMFKLALQIVGKDNSITIFRDDLGYQRIEYTRDDLQKYISSH